MELLSRLKNSSTFKRGGYKAVFLKYGTQYGREILESGFSPLFFVIFYALFGVAYLKNQLGCKKTQSVYFIGNCYHSFYLLSQTLKKRGWKAISVNPDGECWLAPYADKNVCLTISSQALKVFFEVAFKYKFLQVYNRTENTIYTGVNPLLKHLLSAKNLRKCGVHIIYTPSGCLDGSTAGEINKITQGLCNKCIWQGNDWVCNDKTNQKKIEWIMENCVLFSNEVDLPKKLSYTDIGLRIPLLPLCAETLNPSLGVPPEFKISKQKNEIIVFTAFGNEHLRSNKQKDIKGKKYILSAINQLIEEGHPIKHFHATSIPSQNMKYYQVQADIIVDQLNYGTIGAAAREGMMLGKPVICHVSDLMRRSNIAMKGCPAINATEESIYEALKDLILMPASERLEIGKRSREWMLKWFDADVCAARYEKITECILNKEPLTPQEKFI